jgi:hypothetical protein
MSYAAGSGLGLRSLHGMFVYAGTNTEPTHFDIGLKAQESGEGIYIYKFDESSDLGLDGGF